MAFSLLFVSLYPILIPLNKLAYFFVCCCFLFHFHIYIEVVGGSHKRRFDGTAGRQDLREKERVALEKYYESTSVFVSSL
jgi:hypothetical protein